MATADTSPTLAVQVIEERGRYLLRGVLVDLEHVDDVKDVPISKTKTFGLATRPLVIVIAAQVHEE